MAEAEERVWFSHWTKEYRVRPGVRRPVFEWLEDRPPIKMDWDNCHVDIVGHSSGMARFVVRSRATKNSEYMGDIPVQLRFMLTVDVDAKEIGEPALEKDYKIESPKRKHVPPSVRETPHDRWVLRLGSDAEVWEWTRSDRTITSTEVWRLYEKIRASLEKPGSLGNIFRTGVKAFESVVPVVYQPAVDSLDNFMREIHCHATVEEDTADLSVSLVFNNEQLRKFGLADGIYRWIRRFLYGRSIDIETFRIHFVRDKLDSNYFVFQGIYSGDYGLHYDTIHLDGTLTERKVEYYFVDQRHAAVFVNTSNHALAGHDNNLQLWKWEYVPWADKSPVVLGTKSREELDREFRSFFG